MIHNQSIQWLLENLNKDDIEKILPKEDRKKWNQTETEEDFLSRSDSERPHNKAVKGILNLDPTERKSFRELHAAGLIELPLAWGDGGKMANTNYEFNTDPENVSSSLLFRNFKRLKLRQLWQDAVYFNTERSAFWGDPEKVQVIHSIGLFKEKSSPTADVDHAKECLTIAQTMITSPNVELSAFALAPPVRTRTAGGYLAFEITDRKIVWASKEDSWTQFLSSADDETKKYFEIRRALETSDTTDNLIQSVFGADLVKFPSNGINHEDVLFSEKDFVEIAGSFAREVIIKDYTISPETSVALINETLTQEVKDVLVEGLDKLSKDHFGGQQFLIEYV